MLITLKRSWYAPDNVEGMMTADTLPGFTCFTLEPKPRVMLIYNYTAIPAGTYGVVITYSPHFKRLMPLLVHIPLDNYDDVRIHPLNFPSQTQGCIGVARNRMTTGLNGIGDEIQGCAPVFNPLFSAICSELGITTDSDIQTIVSQVETGKQVNIKIIDTYAPIEALSDPNYFKGET